ncbi:carbohydrate ABC transporter permease [Paenibacillus chondroitinus]|uniref:Carbohydrate ABC transporter permease n=2 Tax=Paenibacillus TaxID=44249 RepID=A0ABU6DFG3_9BACL|nr:carbohydrate ABC transporter permease [Paenibacillus chondroitinus]MCY9659176.1 carbohydrate ABC transporter permease [Paenibacillus anseongense]MEB4796489.1 carbohydrate ABC transporter permease [Paenibacillus chondroitinus]
MFGSQSSSVKLVYGVIYVFLAVLAMMTLFPFIHVLSTSLSSSRAIMSGEVFLWPKEITFTSFKNLIEDGQLFNAMKNTLIITVVGTSINLVATIMAAYPLSRKRLKGRNALLMIITFTMLFGGGIIPNYILIKTLGIMNTYWALWLPGLLSTYNFFVMKSFFEGLPSELEESAAIDGANDLFIIWKIILPLSMPIIAALTLFYSVTWWNSYMNVLMYITNSGKLSLMVKLLQMIDTTSQNLLNTNATNGSEGASMQTMVTPEGLRAAAIIISVLPILCVYPFLQKYFVKGVLIGSIKG